MKVPEPKCPRCGAPLAIKPNQTHVTCAFCDLSSVIEREKPPTSISPGHSVVYVPKARRKIVYLAVSLVGLCAIGAIAKVANLSRSAPAGTLWSRDPESARFFFLDRPMLADVNRDGHVDIIGKCTWWQDSVEQGYIGAFDGKTGAKLWASAALSKDQLDSGATRAIATDRVISIDPLGKVQAYDLASGNPAWASLLPDRAGRVCQDDSQIVITAADKSVTGFLLSSGEKRSLTNGAPCREVFSNDDDQAPTYRIIGWSDFAEHGLPDLHSIDGMTAYRALVPSDGGIAFMIGSPSMGTAVATVAAVSNKKVLWKSVVPAVDALRTTVNVTTQKAAYASGRLVMPYHMTDSKQGVRVAAFEGVTGRRLWDVQLFKDELHSLQAVSMCSDTIYISAYTVLFALNLADGSLRFRVGKE